MKEEVYTRATYYFNTTRDFLKEEERFRVQTQRIAKA